MAVFSGDPNPQGHILCEVKNTPTGYRVERTCDNGSEARIRRIGPTPDLEFANFIASSCAAAEGGTVIGE